MAEASSSAKTLFDKLTLTPCTNGMFLASASVGAIILALPGSHLVSSTPPPASAPLAHPGTVTSDK